MILNPGKNHYMGLGNEVLHFNNLTIKSSKIVQILGINFTNHIKSICRKAGQKLSALLRIFEKLCSRESNNLINKIHERSLRNSYKDQKTSYHILLEIHNKLTIHQRNLQVLTNKIYEIVNGVASPIMNSLFEFRSNEYNISNFQILSTDFRRTVNYGIETQLHTERHPFGQKSFP